MSCLNRKDSNAILKGQNMNEVNLIKRGDKIDCSPGEDKDLDRRITKAFYTHEAWLKTIRDRTRSTGDCGYKTHAFLDYLGDPNSEIIDVTFQKLKQDMNEVKYNVTEKEIIYKGNEINPISSYRSDE